MSVSKGLFLHCKFHTAGTDVAAVAAGSNNDCTSHMGRLKAAGDVCCSRPESATAIAFAACPVSC